MDNISIFFEKVKRFMLCCGATTFFVMYAMPSTAQVRVARINQKEYEYDVTGNRIDYSVVEIMSKTVSGIQTPTKRKNVLLAYDNRSKSLKINLKKAEYSIYRVDGVKIKQGMSTDYTIELPTYYMHKSVYIIIVRTTNNEIYQWKITIE